MLVALWAALTILMRVAMLAIFAGKIAEAFKVLKGPVSNSKAGEVDHGVSFKLARQTVYGAVTAGSTAIGYSIPKTLSYCGEMLSGIHFDTANWVGVACAIGVYFLSQFLVNFGEYLRAKQKDYQAQPVGDGDSGAS